MALYERPANLFVAGFLGSPAMNVLTGRLHRDGGLALDLGGAGRLPLGEPVVRPEWLGREVCVGVRPEHLLPSAGEGSFDPEVEVVEPVGSEVYVNLRFGPHALVARLGPDLLPEPGRPMSLAVSPRHLHFFDARSGVRLSA
jgi:multiple sugar transport system ATP-binding protein